MDRGPFAWEAVINVQRIWADTHTKRGHRMSADLETYGTRSDGTSA